MSQYPVQSKLRAEQQWQGNYFARESNDLLLMLDSVHSNTLNLKVCSLFAVQDHDFVTYDKGVRIRLDGIIDKMHT